jgi:amidase
VSGSPDPFTSAREAAAAIRRRQLSPLELLDACLARVDELDGRVNAVIWRNDDEARAAARAAGEALLQADGEHLPPFFGVPIPVKDLTPVAGWPVTYGSWGAKDAPSEESELVVEALERAGFVLCGRTNTPEFGPLTVAENDRYGVTRNPWDLERTPGGSSGGAAAAVAAGMFPLAHANDGGGSIRIPASCCGLVGLKVSRGRVPRRVQSWEGAAVEGVVTRDVADTAAVLDAVCGPEPLQWYNAPAPARPFFDELRADPGRLRMGLVETAPLGLPMDDECGRAVRAAGVVLESLGHVVSPTTLHVPDEFVQMFLRVVDSGLADYEDVDWERAEPHIQASLAAARAVDSIEYVRSVHALQRMSRQIVARWGAEFDVLATPTMAILPPPAGQLLAASHQAAGTGFPPMEVIQMALFTGLFNVTGQPAVSLPVHVTDDGLPVGVQLVGGPFDEAGLLRVGAQLEQALGWTARRPAL